MTKTAHTKNGDSQCKGKNMNQKEALGAAPASDCVS
jgi:hypothetical protein